MDAAAKQQVTERIKQANNILVTVSNNPSVDQLAACIGLTLLLNQMDKHATAVFSGQIPSTLEFLQPEKTIETSTDSLRDFIVSLDKNKADKLRYKVEDNVVRIFITPYKTSLSERDLVFSQGDYNVEAVIALGIKDRTQIDAAITAHGRILHDATVISFNTGAGKAPDLGQINWQDPAASSLCEMVVSISEAFGNGLIDNQMATAFLTGIVAETKRFSNEKTSPKVMTMSAQLMAAGANQQLIVSKLEPPPPPPPKQAVKYVPGQPPAPKREPGGALQAELQDGTLTIKHDKKARAQDAPDEITIDAQGNLITPIQPVPEAEEIAEPPPPSSPPSPPPAPTPPPATPPPKPPTPPEPLNPHALLSPDGEPPFLAGTAFTANAQPEWTSPYNSVSIDPLSGGQTTPQASQSQKPAQAEASVETARSAVESALSASSTDSGPPAEQPAATAPPFPPPLTPAKGVVIPAAGTTGTSK